MPDRVVALGASNLTRGFQSVVAASRDAWGSGVEVVAALGHGRSYGARSRFLARTLPGILDSGLWQQLERLPAATTRALITDVGNDILYGHGSAQTLAWVAEAVGRLRVFTTDIVVAGLPLASIRSLTVPKFLAFRSILVPSCRLPLASVIVAAEEVQAGLEELARDRGLRFQPLREQWYGIDPIHMRPSQWQPAWCEILAGDAARAPVPRGARLEGFRLYLMRPEREWLLGRERVSAQSGVPLRAGGRVWLF